MQTDTVYYNDVELIIQYEYNKYIPAKISGPPEQCYPAEGGDVEILSIWLEDTDISELLHDDVYKKTQDILEVRCQEAQNSSDYY